MGTMVPVGHENPDIPNRPAWGCHGAVLELAWRLGEAIPAGWRGPLSNKPTIWFARPAGASTGVPSLKGKVKLT